MLIRADESIGSPPFLSDTLHLGRMLTLVYFALGHEHHSTHYQELWYASDAPKILNELLLGETGYRR